MANTTLTNNEIFELVTELVAGAVSQQPGVLSIRSTDEESHSSEEVLFKQLLITVTDAQFEEYLEQCQHPRGVYSVDGADDAANTSWTTWTPWSKEDLARFAVQVPEASHRCDNHTAFKEFARELLEQHAALRAVIDLYTLQCETNAITFVLTPEHPEAFVEKMRAMRIHYRAEDVRYLQYVSDEGTPVFTDEDINDLTELQKGRLFDPTIKKFVNPMN